jgi:DNA-binding NarL/FixJ family response regulator
MNNRHPRGSVYSGIFPLIRRRGSNRYIPLAEDSKKFLAELAPRYQEVLRASGSMDDIAAQLNLPLGTVKSRLHRARKALTDLIARDAEHNRQ